MKRDDIIRMAREAGMLAPQYRDHAEHLERFAALVASAEREACAKLCEDLRDLGEEDRANTELAKDQENMFAIRHYQVVSMFNHGMSKCASAIRARGTP